MTTTVDPSDTHDPTERLRQVMAPVRLGFRWLGTRKNAIPRNNDRRRLIPLEPNVTLFRQGKSCSIRSIRPTGP